MSLNGFNFMLADAAQQATSGTQQTAPNPQAEMIKMLGMIVFFGVMMWLIMIRPQQKKAKEHDALMKTIKPGDKVVTASGIIGVVVTVKDRSVSLRSADTKLEVLKSAVSEISERGGESAEAKT